jgi:tRNA nucleotidyltransferase (CCA-adding enzyme)
MKIYMVGGAVRDEILGKMVHDRDYVVTDSSEDEMLALGYERVGKSFPVFLHPETREEYALARKENKIGSGHCDFKVIATPHITLEEDAHRRDFTCNALYKDIKNGEIIDYHNGKQDIKNRILRHVSEQFSEDPLRVLRMCRFAAQLNFTVAPETMDLCHQMVKDGALKCLSKDRIWQEFVKALASKTFYRFIETARECDLLAEILPEVECLFSVPEREDYHPEKNSGEHTLLTIKAAASDDAMINYAALLHDIGKIKTDKACWPSHRGHDKLGVDIIKEIGQRLRAPKAYTELASFTALNHMIYHQKLKNARHKLANIAIGLSYYKHLDYISKFIAVLNADMNGRGKPATTSEQACFAKFEKHLKQLYDKALTKRPSELPEFAELIDGIKNGTVPPAKLNEKYIEMLLQEVPYPSE